MLRAAAGPAEDYHGRMSRSRRSKIRFRPGRGRSFLDGKLARATGADLRDGERETIVARSDRRSRRSRRSRGVIPSAAILGQPMTSHGWSGGRWERDDTGQEGCGGDLGAGVMIGDG